MGCINFPAVAPIAFLQYQPSAAPLFLVLFGIFYCAYKEVLCCRCSCLFI